MLRSRQHRRSDGFTLLELMIVVTVIAVMAAVAGPSIAAGVQEQRSARAASDMVRLMTRARSASQGYGRAYLARYTAVSGGGNGSIQVYRGLNNRCNATDWPTVMLGTCASNPLCIESLDMREYARGDQTVRMRAPGHNPLDICFEPSGRTFYRRSASGIGGRFTDRNTSADRLFGGFRFSFVRRVGGTPKGVTRWVVVPLGGDARVLR
ncbi:MAG: prepilin-type N-terminal cleavage/methylation domain-containing protein [Deltaproteobacteria bacterium]|nr:prepilin-type N-terminal cleavage/methylation domain-containing protein [Deltaproteobacteria bacterium]